MKTTNNAICNSSTRKGERAQNRGLSLYKPCFCGVRGGSPQLEIKKKKSKSLLRKPKIFCPLPFQGRGEFEVLTALLRMSCNAQLVHG